MIIVVSKTQNQVGNDIGRQWWLAKTDNELEERGKSPSYYHHYIDLYLSIMIILI